MSAKTIIVSVVYDESGKAVIRLILDDGSYIDLPDCTDNIQTLPVAKRIRVSVDDDPDAGFPAVGRAILTPFQLTSSTIYTWVVAKGVTYVEGDSQLTIEPSDDVIIYLEAAYTSPSGDTGICKGCIRPKLP